MRAPLVVVAASLVLVSLAACPSPPSESCGVSTTPPTADEVADGQGKATRSDGVAFEEAGDWAPAPSSSIVIGVLSMIIANDETGSVVDDLISDGAFPICVPQAARSQTSGQANFVDGGFVTDDTHKGGVAILGLEGDLLIGRFAFELANPQGETLSFDDGVFRVPQR